MNAPLQHAMFPELTAAGDASFAFELARSRLLDAFFELEVTTAGWLRHLDEKASPRPLGQRLEQLAAHPQLEARATRKQIRQIQRLVTQCAGPLRIRNAIVHSRRDTGTRGGEACFFLATLETALDDERSYVVVTLSEIEDTVREVRRLAGQLSLYLSQASSPRPPSPDAAGGP